MSNFEISKTNSSNTNLYNEISDNLVKIKKNEKFEISFKNEKTEKELSSTEIMGGEFSKVNTKKPAINLKSEYSYIKFDKDGNIDVNQFSLETLSAKYKGEQYIIENSNGYTIIKNKDTGNTVLKWNDTTKEYVDENTNTFYKLFDYPEPTVVMEAENTETGRDMLDNYKMAVIKDGKIVNTRICTNNVLTNTFYNKDYQILKQETIDRNKDITYNTEYLNGEKFITYDEKGNVVKFDASENLHTNLSNLNGDKAYCTKMIKSILEKTPEEINKFMESYAKFQDSELIDDINNTKILTKDKKQEFLKNLTGDFFDIKGYSPFKELKNKQVKNKYYTGDNFDVKFSGHIVNITNNTTGQKTRMDLSQLFSEMSVKDKKNMAKLIQELPAEVLFDLSIECTKINSMRKHKNLKEQKTKVGGFYSPIEDEITTRAYNSIAAQKILIHELGHAIDNGEFSERTTNSEFEKIFLQELKEYTDKGYKQFDYNNPPNFIEQIFKKNNYCTANVQEMFAECYALLLEGKCGSDDTILKHFPKSLEAAKQLLIDIRKESPEARHYSEQ